MNANDLLIGILLLATSIVWLNLDILGYEHRFESHLVFNIGAGWFNGISGSYRDMNLCISESCSPPALESAVGINYPQAHLGLGYWF